MALMLTLSLLGACANLGIKSLAAYDVTVVVFDEQRQPLVDALVQSTNSQETRTDDEGRARLFYANGGLHVITVSAEGWETVQTKITLPLAEEAPVTISMEQLATRSILPPSSFVDTQ